MFYTKTEIDTKIENYKHNLSEMVNDIGFITEADIPTRTSQLNNDAGFLTSQEAYTKGSVYTKAEVDAIVNGYTPDTTLDAHTHDNKFVLDKLGEVDGLLAYNGIKVDIGTSSGTVDLSGYATETMLSQGLATKAPLEHTHEQYLTEHQSLDAYFTREETKKYVTDSITEAQLGGEEVDLSGYALKTEIPSLEGYAKTSELPDVTVYQTVEQVNALIDAKLGVIENGTY